MALLSIFKRKDITESRQSESADIAQARARSRRRMIGAAVLLALGVIAFPLLFETQPRPIPVDIPIEIPPKEGQPALVAPPKAPRVSQGQVVEPAAAPAASSEVLAAPKVDPKTGQKTEPKAESKAEPKPAAKPEPRPAPKPEPAAPPAKPVKPAVAEKPTAAATPSVAAKPADADTRFVVQVGAFADATAARDVRLKIEKMGLKTYTQIVQTAQGRRTRVRLGPFNSQDEANRTLSRLKSAGLPGAVITL